MNTSVGDPGLLIYTNINTIIHIPKLMTYVFVTRCPRNTIRVGVTITEAVLAPAGRATEARYTCLSHMHLDFETIWIVRKRSTG